MATKSNGTKNAPAATGNGAAKIAAPETNTMPAATGNSNGQQEQRQLVNASPFDALLSKLFRNAPTQDQMAALTNFLQYSGYLGLVQVAKSLSTVETILKTLLEKGGNALSNDIVTLFTWRADNAINDEYTVENLGAFFELMETTLAQGYEEYVEEQLKAGKMFEDEVPENFAFSVPRWNSTQQRFTTQGVAMDSGKIRFASVWLNRTFGAKGNGQLVKANAVRRERINAQSQEG